MYTGGHFQSAVLRNEEKLLFQGDMVVRAMRESVRLEESSLMLLPYYRVIVCHNLIWCDHFNSVLRNCLQIKVQIVKVSNLDTEKPKKRQGVMKNDSYK